MSSIKGHFDGTGVVLDEPPPVTLTVGQPVRIVVDPQQQLPDGAGQPARRSLAGFAQGMFEMRGDFNDPLEEFAEYR